MQRAYAFRILNVFSMDVPFSGNPLCVFEDGRGLSDVEMQAFAKQFNLSETTFILPSQAADAFVRIFTPTYEMPFAGHPTLGTASVVSDMSGGRNNVTLQMGAGTIPVELEAGRWTLRVQHRSMRSGPPREVLAGAFGLAATDILEGAAFVDAGREQLIVPVASEDAVRRATPSASAFAPDLLANDGHLHALLWSVRSALEIYARFFFDQGPSLLEDPATGSACANLGGWLLANKQSGPSDLRILQGEQVQRPSLLFLTLRGAEISVGGRVTELGRGAVLL